MVNVVLTGQGKCFAGLARPGSPTDAVDIIFRILGQIVIDHVADIFNMNAAGGDVGGDQNFDLALFELFHQPKPFALGQISSDPFSRPAIPFKLGCQPINADLGIHKNEHPIPVFSFQQTQQ